MAVAIRPGSAAAHNVLGILLNSTGDREGAIAEYRQAVALDPNDVFAHNNLGLALLHQTDWDGALAELNEALRLAPKSAIVQFNIGVVLKGKGEREEALAAFRKAIVLDPKYAPPHAGLGRILADKKDLDGAIAEFRQALKLDPKDAVTQDDLGFTLLQKNDLDGAIAAYQRAVALDPKADHAYRNLGLALRRKKDWNGAIAALNRAIALNPRVARSHLNLGAVLYEKKDLDGAIAEYRQALALDRKLVGADRGLGFALAEKRDWDEAIAAYRRSLDLDPADVAVASGLSKALLQSGRLEEACAPGGTPWKINHRTTIPGMDTPNCACSWGKRRNIIAHRKALLERFGNTTDPTIAERTGRACLLLPVTGDELRQAAALADRAVAAGPKHPYYVFFTAAKGLAEYRRDHLDSAIDWLGKAIAGKAFMPARLVLAMAQHRRGQIEQARRTLAEAIQSYNWERTPVGNHDIWICHVLRREAEALIVPNLAAFLRGDYQPGDNAERLELTMLCHFQLRPLAAVHLFVDAFAADPKLVDDVNANHRYNAACHAMRTGSGQGKDAAKIDDKERVGWRQQARDWLRADLSAYGKRLDGGKPEDRRFVQERLQHWQRDSDLAGLRDKESVARLPNEEQEACRKLWADVDALLRKAQEKSK